MTGFTPSKKRSNDRELDLVCITRADGSRITAVAALDPDRDNRAVIYLDAEGNTVAFDPATETVEWGRCAVNPVEPMQWEQYRLAGSGTGASTAAIGPGSTPNVGNTLLIEAPFQALTWRFNRETEQDPGNGTVGSVTVNGLTYYPGSGPQYQEVGEEISSVGGEYIATDVQFDVDGAAFIEVKVLR